MDYFVYILQSQKGGSFYTGHTGNLEQRVHRHNEGRSAYTRTRMPWKLIYKECFGSKSDAMKREQEIKAQKNRGYIIELVRTSRM